MNQRLNQAKKLVKKYAKIMNLQQWNIEVVEDNNPNVHGTCWVNIPRNYAKITINTEINDFEKHIEGTVIHELTHIIHWEIDTLFYNLTGDLDSKQMEEYMDNLYSQTMEKFIDWNTRIIERLAKQK